MRVVAGFKDDFHDRERERERMHQAMHNSDLLLSPTPESREAGPSCGWLVHGTHGEILRENEKYFMRMKIQGLIGFTIRSRSKRRKI